MMHSFFSANNLASATSRFGATIDVEMNHVRFLGSLVLNLWDCGGQETFLDSYLASQRNTIFRDVGVLIYVFDVETRDFERDISYYIECLDACRKNSPEADIFVLIHKMDLVTGGKRERTRAFELKKRELDKYSGSTPIKMFGTSIWDETLYKATNRTFSLLPPHLVLIYKLIGMVSYCARINPKCSSPLIPLDFIRQNMLRYRNRIV
jgi:Ras-related GTP-binding protein A/B